MISVRLQTLYTENPFISLIVCQIDKTKSILRTFTISQEDDKVTQYIDTMKQIIMAIKVISVGIQNGKIKSREMGND